MKLNPELGEQTDLDYILGFNNSEPTAIKIFHKLSF